jgi:alkylation response protein AidB-like acyl-CoA dehydrogenase
MDFNDTPDEAAFREEVRGWLAQNAPPFQLPPGEPRSDVEQMAGGRAWQRRLAEGGFAGILLPKSVGGRGETTTKAVIFAEEEARYALPKGAYIGIGLGMALPVIAKHGSEQQIERFAAPTLRGDLTWCQLFSEPGAGSDLAAVRTRAVRQGDDWVVNGQKVWSSWAHLADWGILLLRTNPKVPKHKGLTFFVIDMKSPGIDVRPIRQISGASDFNETFLADVHVPDSCRIGAVGDGWACAMTVLLGERLNQGAEGKQGSIAGLIDYAAATLHGDGTALASSANRLWLARAYAEEQAERHLQARLRTMVSRGENPGALAAIIKLVYSNRLQKTSALASELRGIESLAYAAEDVATARIWESYIWSTALRIAGGADEVLRNQISERVLGMPGDLRMDKDVPFDKL